jgi:hypothetical protein
LSSLSAKFEKDLITINNSNVPMGLHEAVLDDVKKQGIQEGRQEGLLEGIELEKRSFTLKLWDLQEFSLEKIELLVGLSEKEVLEIVGEHLQVGGLTEEAAKIKIEDYKEQFGDQK